jgi:transketolase
VTSLKNVATRLRIDSLRSTTEAGSGHPTSCCSAAEIVSALFFAEMRYDPRDSKNPHNDRFVLSKGHAAPVLYAAWAEAGIIPRDELLTLRRIDSDLEGHPTPRLPWVDVATGSLGQGICAAVGIALNARRIASDYRTYVLLGDGESAEGSVWEAAEAAVFHALDSLCAIIDVNALGQSQPTQWQHDMDGLAVRWKSYGWHTLVIDGHDLVAVIDALESARGVHGRPTMILARTLKGKGVSEFEGKPGWHGKTLKKGAELDAAIRELEAQFLPERPDPDEQLSPGTVRGGVRRPSGPGRADTPVPPPSALAAPPYELGKQVATREAYGDALARLGAADARIVVLDADVKNSTFTDRFEKVAADRFHEMFIAEQVMIGAAMGLAARGAIPFPSTFGAFLSRAYDFIRMAAISHLNVKMCGSHVGVSIGEDGPSQMALEDLAMMRAQPNVTVLYPSDAVSTERLVREAADHAGPVYLRTSRPKTPVIYGTDEAFPIGGLKVLRSDPADAAVVVAAGVTVHEALTACDQLRARGIHIRVVDLYSVQPVDEALLTQCAKDAHGRVITVEDHYAAGGIGDAVATALAPAGFTVHRIAVREIPRSGTPEELLDRYGISARHIVTAVMRLVSV